MVPQPIVYDEEPGATLAQELSYVDVIQEILRRSQIIDAAVQSSTQSKPNRHPFEDRVDRMKPSKTDINFVVMDYLINEGYPAAAKKFAAEANITHSTGESEFIQERVEIRNAILSGEIRTAIEKLNDLNPDLLELDTGLHFSLLRLQLIGIIQKCIASPNADITPALTFAQTHLAPRASTNSEFLADLERTMALLIFPPENMTPSLAGLLKPELRQSTATKVNEAILTSQGFRSQPRLKGLVQLRVWAERKAREQGIDLPEHLDFWPNDGKPKESEDSEMTNNGNTEAMAL